MKIQLLEETADAAPFIANAGWCVQEKINGERMLVVKRGNEVVAFNRNGIERALPETVLALALLSDADWTIDGEIVGQQFTAFDLLDHAGNDATNAQQCARLTALQLVSPFSTVRTASGDEKQALLELIHAEGGEGVVFKNMEAPYRDGRDANAVKCKFWKSENFIVDDVNIAKGTIGLFREGKLFGRCSFPLKGAWPKVGETVEVRFSHISKNGKCIHPVLLGIRSDCV